MWQETKTKQKISSYDKKLIYRESIAGRINYANLITDFHPTFLQKFIYFSKGLNGCKLEKSFRVTETKSF